MGKLLAALVAEDLNHICESNNILPAMQFGGRPRRTTMDALHLLTQQIKDVECKGEVVTALFLDIQAAFPHVVPERLLHNMRARQIPEQLVQFIEGMLEGRSTRLKFNDFISDIIAITNGNSQGCPLSMILYSFYIAPLLEIADGKRTTTIGFVDDTTLVAKGKTFTETHQLIRDLLEKTNGALEWSHSHDSPLELSKRLESRDLEFTMKHQDGTTSTRQIERVDTYKLLGVMIDSKLTWRHHHDLVQERALKWTALFCRLN
jgi:hypothetical protein